MVQNNPTCVQDCGEGWALNSVDDCVQQCPDTLIDSQGRYCDKKPTKYDWLSTPIFKEERDGVEVPIMACPDGMLEVEDGSACVKGYFEPKHATPSCGQGLVIDELTGPKCKSQCDLGYYSVFDYYCYAVCP